MEEHCVSKVKKNKQEDELQRRPRHGIRSKVHGRVKRIKKVRDVSSRKIVPHVTPLYKRRLEFVAKQDEPGVSHIRKTRVLYWCQMHLLGEKKQC